MPYLGRNSQKAIRQRFIFTQSSAGATSISGADDSNATLRFDDGEYVDVILNGITLAKTEYNTLTANTISGLAALSSGDVLQVTVYDMFNVADAVSASSGGTFNGGVTINGDLTVTGSGAGAAGVVSASTSGTAISIDSSNRVTQPSQPAFLARRNSTSSALALNTTHDMEFASEVFDVGSNFSNPTFTAPVTGKYQLNWCVYLQGLDTATQYYQFIVITSNRDFYNIFTSSALGGDAAYQSFVWGGLIDMDANDTAKVTLQIPNSGTAQSTIYGGSADGATFFSGFLAC